MTRLPHILLLAVALCIGGLAGYVLKKSPAVEAPAPWIDIATDSGRRVPLKTVMLQTTGTKVIGLDSDNPAHRKITRAIKQISTQVGDELSRDHSPAHEKRRINEVSSLFEDALRIRLDALPEFSCQVPLTLEGKQQRSGYPDLRLEHLPTRTVAYLDPKLFQHDSRKSSLRTFYYEATGNGTKVTEDALHLLLGFPHDGNNGQWKFSEAELVDLSDLDLKLKVEFSASNKDLYPR